MARPVAAPGAAEPAQGAPEADAAAAAAAAAVSAAIAATAAATRGGGAHAKGAAGAAPSGAPAKGAAPAEAGAAAPPVWPGAIPPRPADTVSVPYERPPGRDVPGLTRARRDESDAAAAAQAGEILPPAAMPWGVNPAPPEAVSPFFPRAEPARTAAEPARPTARPARPSTPSAATAVEAAGGPIAASPVARATLGRRLRTGVIAVGSAFAVFCLPILLGLGRVATFPVRAVRRRVAGTRAVARAPEAGASRPRRWRVSKIWIVVGGFYLFSALILGAGWYMTIASPPSPSVSLSHTTTNVAVATTSVVPSGTPTAAPSPSSSPTPVPAKPLLTVEETEPVAVGTSATFRVQFIPGTECRLTRTYVAGATPHPAPTPVSPKTSSSFPIQDDGWSLKTLWGGQALGWPAEAGTWSITASCTPHLGGTASPPSDPVTVIWV